MFVCFMFYVVIRWPVFPLYLTRRRAEEEEEEVWGWRWTPATPGTSYPTSPRSNITPGTGTYPTNILLKLVGIKNPEALFLDVDRVCKDPHDWVEMRVSNVYYLHI